ncbi:26S proteasome regulatory subunit N12, partial [Tremellales sp. Uapishka_1]
MSVDLQQALSELHTAFDTAGDSKDDVSTRLKSLKLELAQSGLYFAPPSANPQDLLATRSILEIAAFHSLRTSNLKAYAQYSASLEPFYTEPVSELIPASANRPVILGLHLLSLLSEGKLTEFHTVIETLKEEQLKDAFVRWPVDLERWLMEGAYNKVYKARERVPREEYGVLLANLMGTVRGQIASTIEASYPSLPLSNAAALLFFQQGETKELNDFAAKREWVLEPSTSSFTFPKSATVLLSPFSEDDVSSQETFTSTGTQGVQKGLALRSMIGPALRIATQLEAIV